MNRLNKLRPSRPKVLDLGLTVSTEYGRIECCNLTPKVFFYYNKAMLGKCDAIIKKVINRKKAINGM